MFSGTVESKSHEGGLLIHFEGSSPSLNAIMVRSDDGTYIGKVDGVLGSTNHALAHIAHIDRSLNMDELIGVQVTVRAKKQREERPRRDSRPQGRDYDDRRQGSQGDRSQGRTHHRGRDDRSGNRGFQRDRNGRGDRQTFDGDWDCPSCNNSNFARRTECNRCQAPRPDGGGSRGERPRGDRRGGFERRDDRRRDDRRDGGFRNNRDDRRRDDRRDGGFRNNRDDRRRDDRRDGGFRNNRDDRRRDDRRDGGFRNNRDDRRRDDQRGGRREGGNFNTNDWTCPACNNSNFSFRNACNRCEAPRPGGGGGGGNNRGGFRRNDGPNNRGGYRPQRNDDRRGRDERRNDDRGGRDRRQNDRRSSSDGAYRRSRGKRSGHAHNQPPKDFRTSSPRKFDRKRDD